MRKIFKFLSYSLLYLVVSLASAYGVITFSMNGISGGNSNSGTGGGGTGQVVVAEEISTIVTNLASSEVIDINLDANLGSEGSYYNITISGQVDLSQGLENIALDAMLTLDIGQSAFDVGLNYQNGALYFELLNGKFMLATDNLMSSIGQVTSLLGVELPDLSGILGGLDVNSILGLLSNFTESENDDGSKVLDISIPMVEGLSIALNCTSDYHLTGFELPAFEMSGMSIGAEATIGYPETSKIEDVNSDDFIAINDVIDVALGVIDYASNCEGKLAFSYAIDYDNLNFNGNIFVDINERSGLVTFNYDKISANVILKNGDLYLEIGNIYLKFDLANIDEVCSLAENYFGITLPKDLLTSLVSALESGDFSQVFEQVGTLNGEQNSDINEDEQNSNENEGVLDENEGAQTSNLSPALTSFNLNSLDINSIDLSIIEKFEYENGKASIVIRDIVEFDILLNNGTFSGVTVNAFGVNGTLNVIDFKEINLGTDEGNYIEIGDLIPTVENLLGILQNNTFSGEIFVNANGFEVKANYTLFYSENPYIVLSTTLYGQTLDITILNGKAYIEIMNNKIVIDLNNIENLVNTLKNSSLGSEITALIESAGDITDEITSALENAGNSLLFTSFVKNGDGFEIEVLDKFVLTVANSENKLDVSAKYDNINVSLSLSGRQTEIKLPLIDDNDYVNIESLVNTVINVYDYILAKEFYLTLSASYGDISLEGALNFAGEKLEVSLLLTYKDLTASVMIYNGNIYIVAENIRLVFDLDDIGLVKSFLNDYLDINVDKLLSDLLGHEVVLDSNLSSILTGLDLSGLVSSQKGGESGVNINEILKTLTLKLTQNEISLSYNGVEVSVNLEQNMISGATFGYLLDGQNISASLTVEGKASVFSPAGEYINVAELLDYAEVVIDYFADKKFELGLDLAIGNTNISGNAQIDITDQLMLSASVLADGTAVNVNIEDGMLYFDYNGLLLKMDNNGFNELLYIVLEVLGVDANSIPFLSDLDLDLDFSMIDTDIASMDISIDEILGMLKMIKEIKNTDGSLIITLDGKVVYGKENAEDIVITLATESGKLSSLSLENCYLDSNFTNLLKGTIYFNQLSSFGNVDTSKNYIDISGANELVKAIVNMSNDKQFHVSGAFDIVATIDIVSKLPINISVPIDVYINVVGKGDVELYGVIGEIPAVIGLNNDVPYEVGDTESGSDRYLYFYYQNGYVYLYRTEYVDIMFGASKRQYEKCTKIPLDTLLAKPLYYLQYGIGLTDTIMEVIIEAMDNPRTEPMDMGNIISSFEVDDSKMGYTVNLNMYELTNNSDLGNMAVTLGLQQDANGRNYIGQYGINLELPLADAFYMSLSTSNLRMVDYGKEIDMSPLYEYVNNYQYANETEWEASNGDWKLASEIVYSINFVTNSDKTIESQNYHYKEEINLPTMDEYYIVSDSASRTSYFYSFAGWFEDEQFTQPFTQTTMTRGDITLYAKWNYVKSEKSIQVTFVSNGGTTYESVIVPENSTLDLSSYQPTKPLTYIENGWSWSKWKYEFVVTRYTFEGWYTDDKFYNQFNGNVGNSDITLYAKYTETVTTEYLLSGTPQ